METVQLGELKSWFIDTAGAVSFEVCGVRLGCQRCPCVYSLSGTGVFRHHRLSWPMTPENRDTTPRDEPGPPDAPFPTDPRPRRRPRDV